MHRCPSRVSKIASAEKSKLATVPRLLTKPVNRGAAILFLLKQRPQKSPGTAGPPATLQQDLKATLGKDEGQVPELMLAAVGTANQNNGETFAARRVITVGK